MVDSQGLLLRVVSHPCHIADRAGAKWVLLKLKGYVERLKVVLVDGAYNGALDEWLARTLGAQLQVAVSVTTQRSGATSILPPSQSTLGALRAPPQRRGKSSFRAAGPAPPSSMRAMLRLK